MTQDGKTNVQDYASGDKSGTSGQDQTSGDLSVDQIVEKAVSDALARAGRSEKQISERLVEVQKRENQLLEERRAEREQRDRREREAVAGDSEALKGVEATIRLRAREEAAEERERKAELREKEAEAKFAAVSAVTAKSEASDIVAMKDDKGNALYGSVSAELLLGLTEDSPADKRKGRMEQLAQAISGRSPAEAQIAAVKRQQAPDIARTNGTGGGAGRSITRGEYKAMSPKDASQFAKDGGTVDWSK